MMLDVASALMRSFDETKEHFFESGDGLDAVGRATASTDQIVRESFAEVFPDAAGAGIALLAVGGYGRAQLFPFSDVDLLFLCSKESDAKNQKKSIAQLLTRLWDAKLRISQSVRTPQECTRLAPDNAELHISLLDTRFLCGEQAVFDDLGARLPRFFQRERDELLRNLSSLAKSRHARFGRTIYHLEPNVKETPGGLRDFQLACWVSQLMNVKPERVPLSEETLPAESRDVLLEAKRFLFAVRCYLHYFNGRDNNILTFDQQDQVAREGAGKCFRDVVSTAEWMRDYFHHVREIHRLARRMMDGAVTPRMSLLRLFRDYQSRLSNNDFVVTRGKVFLRNSQMLTTQPELLLELFVFVARHGVPPAQETEKRIQQALDAMPSPNGRLWPAVAEILRLPHAYEALTSMHETGVLLSLFPEFGLVDSLVIRDFYHRYTVDEHTFLTIQSLHRLGPSSGPLSERFAAVLSELERPERLYLALLLHDLGKGKPEANHAQASMELAGRAMARMAVEEDDQEFIGFLIRHHLDMSRIMTSRDLSEPETIEEFADLVGTTDRLAALTLMTYADTSSVNPQALTPWRAELLWQLYTSTHNWLTQDAEDRRIHVDPSKPFLKLAVSESEKAVLAEFLEGFPRRYLRTCPPERVYAHFQLSRQLKGQKVAVQIGRRHALHEVVVITQDRPFLFASLCSTLSAFGLNIEKVEAFANEKGLVLDTFVVSDPLRTLELNPNEVKRLSRALNRLAEDGAEVVASPRRARRDWFGGRKSAIEPAVRFDNQTSAIATICHVIAEDRTGLLFDLASVFSQHECDIQVVLIDTQGRKALDVFYVVGPKGKVEDGVCRLLKEELLSACRGR